MKWWYWLIVAIVAAILAFAYVQFGHTQGFPTASPTAFNRAKQPAWSPTATPSPATMLPPPKTKGM